MPPPGVEYVYRIDALSTLRQRLHDGGFRARRFADVATFARSSWRHVQTREALTRLAPGHAVLQMSWWKTIDAAIEAALEYPDQVPHPIQRVRADLPFFAAFERAQDEWLPQAWLFTGTEAVVAPHTNPHLSETTLSHAHFEILSPRGTWECFDQATCFERSADGHAFDLALPPLYPAGFPFHLRVHAFDADGEPWLMVRNRASAIMSLPLHAPAAYRDLAAALAQRVPDLPKRRIALTFERAEDTRIAEVERPAHRWRDRLRGRPAPAWSASMLDHEAAADVLRAAGVRELESGDHRFAYDPAVLVAAGFTVSPDAAQMSGLARKAS
jgi:hypothetical protein